MCHLAIPELLPGTLLGHSRAVAGCDSWAVSGSIAWLFCRNVRMLMLQFHDSGAIAWIVAGCGSRAAVPGLLLGAVPGPSLCVVLGLSQGVSLGLPCQKAGMS